MDPILSNNQKRFRRSGSLLQKSNPFFHKYPGLSKVDMQPFTHIFRQKIRKPKYRHMTYGLKMFPLVIVFFARGEITAQNWMVFNASNSNLPDNAIEALAIDGSGSKWIGTRDSGLAKYDGANWTTFTQSNLG